MKPHDRVLMALDHQEPDRYPMQVSFTAGFASRLRTEMNLRYEKPHNPHGGGNTYELKHALGEDMLLTSVSWANSYYQDAKEYLDEWSIGWKSVEYAVPYPARYTHGEFLGNDQHDHTDILSTAVNRSTR